VNKIQKLEFPINRCTIDLTERCNLRCKYCFTYGVGRRDLDFNMGKKIIDWLFMDEVCQSNEVGVDWWGGEPFLKFDLMKRLTEYVVNKAAKDKKRIMIGGTSNATLWTKEVVDWMNQTRAYFMMSIDGVKEVQDMFRKTAGGGSSWDLIAKNLPYIKQQIPFIRSRMAPTPRTIGKLVESVKYLYEEYGIEHNMFSPVYEMDWTDESLAEAERQMKLLADFMIEKKLEGKQIFIKHLDDGAQALEMNKNAREYPCGAGRFYVGISVDGYIYPCHRFNKYDGKPHSSKYCIGSIYEGITRPDLREPLIKFLDIEQPKCEKCEWFKSLCHVSCYAINYDLTGNVLTPPELHCKWMNAQARAIVYYYEQLKKYRIPIEIPQTGGGKMQSCVCYNMCYSEGTQWQIITADRTTGMKCHCYNTSYTGGLSDQARPLTDDEILKYDKSSDKPSSITCGAYSDDIKLLYQAVLSLNDSVKRLSEIIEKTKK